MSHCQQVISRSTNCSEAEAAQIEEVMRNVIFHSTLDWQTREELVEAARLGKMTVRQMAVEDAKAAKRSTRSSKK
jgi:2-phospho-L-lactate guanylyltransferase (CobY/MobA/RfbA family)